MGKVMGKIFDGRTISDSMVLDLHILQNLPPGCLNRDENGMPKSATFGFRERSRISSQCWKRAIRKYLDRLGLPISVRSRGIPALLRDRLRKAGREDAEIEKAIEAAYKAMDQKIVLSEEKDSMITEHQFSNSREEIERLEKVIDRHFDVLSRVEIPEEDDSKSRKRNNKAAKAKIQPAIQKEIVACFDRAGTPHLALDNNLFGRMLAEDKGQNIEACSQFAHSISTHEVQMDLDFFVAADDLGRNQSDMMESTGFNSGTHYRYANLHLGPYFRATNGMAEVGFKAFLEAVVQAMPTGKQNSFAAHARPDFILGVVRSSGPMSLANAFVSPVRGQDPIQSSIDALVGYLERLNQMYGVKEQKAAFFKTTYKGVKVDGAMDTPSLEEWIQKLWETVRPAEGQPAHA